ncbi:MAG: nucleoside triphosphate pyrophosphohydrolase [Lentisphaerae bacterium GWF2_52_8]|nr:MAG: nucleoside triphosphate pyrophosphohydrolase [Lentisphaerae bacterium GWF2_52_8]
MSEKSDKKEWLPKLLEVIAVLRSPEGCPWDREQTHSSLKQFLMEECAELMDAIDDDDAECICDELGDLLMHVVLHSRIAEEQGRFDFNEVARMSTEKMLRRHPHVFGDAKASCSGEVVKLWEEVKKEEKEGKGKKAESVMDGIPRQLSSLLHAEKIQRRAAKYGFDWSAPEQIVEKIEEELQELRQAMAEGRDEAVDEEIGDLLFAVVNLSRFRKGPSSEDQLTGTIRKFQKRFRHIERRLAENGRNLEEASIDEMEALWQEAKSIKPS